MFPRRLVHACLCCCLSLAGLNACAQLLVSANNTPGVAQFLAGDGVTISNVQVACPAIAMGTFNADYANLGLNGSGVVMTTGMAVLGRGPNRTGAAGVDNGSMKGDEDLRKAGAIPSDVGLYNACVMSFDLKADGPNVSFTYVFASEEYKEFVGSPFNDAFAFFISGPGFGPAPGVNVALLPLTGEPVAINTVNHLTNTTSYVENTPCEAVTCVQYDGFTKPMKATLTLVPNTPYRIKFAIADVFDAIYDSAVFIQAIDTVAVDPLSTERPTLAGRLVRGAARLELSGLTAGMAAQIVRYEVQRSVDGATFETVGVYAADGPIAWQEPAPSVRPAWYRLRLIGADGASQYYTNVVSFRRDGTDAEGARLHVSPNPVGDVLFLDAPAGPLPYRILTPDGRLVRAAVLSDGAASLPVGDLATGVYLLETQTAFAVQRARFCKR